MSLQPDPTWRPRPNYRPRPASPRRSGFGMLVVSGLALFSVGVGYVFMTMRDNAPNASGIVPTIQAEATPFKIRPENPGGIEVLHQDSTVFDALSPESKRAKQEQLLPQPEQPDEKLLAQNSQTPSATNTTPASDVLAARSESANEAAATFPVAPSSGSVALPVFNAEKQAASAVGAVAQEIEQVVPPVAAAAQKTESPFVQELKDVAPVVEVPAIEQKSEAPTSSTASAEAEMKATSQPKPRAEAPKPVAEKEKTTAKNATKSAGNKPLAQTSKKAADVKKEETIDIADILAKTDAVNMVKEEKLAMVTPKAEAMASPEIRQPTKPAALGSGGGMRVQLASSPNEAAAEKLMSSIVNRHASLLRQSRLSLVRTELAGKGTYFRIQTQPMGKEAANDLCAGLKAAQQSCLVVKSSSQ